MATLIPALGSCVARMTDGERRCAERLEQKLDDDYLLWYNVAVGPHHLHTDFVVMHPRLGILILEVKDYRRSTIVQADKQSWDIHTEVGPKTIASPIKQARQYEHQKSAVGRQIWTHAHMGNGSASACSTESCTPVAPH